MAKGSSHQIDLPFDPVRFDTVAFSTFLRDNGTTLQHYKALRCPIGRTDLNDSRNSHAEHDGCSNGHIYEFAGDVTAWFSNNSAISSLTDVGILDGSVVSVTFPTTYDNSDKQVSVMAYDRFFVKELPVTVPHTQEFEAHVVGRDKMTFPIDCVESVMDANGKKYSLGDYGIVNGQLVWTGTNRPAFNADTNKGTIVSIRYQYRPYFYCDRLMHEIRLAKQTDFLSGEVKTVRAPYAALLKREFYYYKTEPDDTKDEPRAMFGPRSGTFGPR